MRSALAAPVVLLLAVGACEGSHRVSLASGGTCLVAKGSAREEVRRTCGAPESYGRFPMAWQMKGCGLVACSPPGDVYGQVLVGYDCDGRVSAFEKMPVASFMEGAE